MKKAMLFLTVITSALHYLAASDDSNMIYWNPDVKVGYFTNPESWIGGKVPTSGDTAAVKDEGGNYRGHYIIKFPSGTTEVKSLINLATQFTDSSITLDTTEGSLYHLPTSVPNDYTGFGFFIYGPHHFFNFERLQSGKPVMCFSGGTIKAWTDQSRISHVDIESGNLNWYNPNSVQTSTAIVFSRPAVVTVKKGSSLDAGAILLRNGSFVVEGGDHRFHADFHVNDANAGAKTLFSQSSGTIRQDGGITFVGRCANSENRFELNGDAEFIQTDGREFQIGAASGTRAFFEMSGNARATLSSFKMSTGNPLDGEIESYTVISNNARLTLLNESIIGLNTLEKIPSLQLSGNAVLNAQGVLRLGYPGAGYGAVSLDDNAVFQAEKELFVHNDSLIAAGEQSKLHTDSSVTLKNGGAVALDDNANFEAMASVNIEKGSLRLANEAVFLAKGDVHVNADSRIDAGGQSKLHTDSSVTLKNGGAVALADDAKFEAMAGMNIEKGLMALTNDAAFLASGNVYVNADCLVDASGASEIRTENGKLTVRSGGTVALSDSARLETVDGADVEGGVLSFSESATLLMNTNVGHQCRLNVINGGLLELNGGDSYFSCLWSEGGNLEKESAIKIKKGTHRSFYQGDGMVPLSIGGTGSKNLFEMSGGYVSIPRMVRVGVGNTGDGYAIFRLSGGTFEINETAGEAPVNVSDEEASKGRVELLGGTLRCQYLRGWTGSKLHNPNATGSATLYADGGLVEPNSITRDTFIKSFDNAILGEYGLTVNTTRRNISISQTFTDEDGKSGLFIKTGEGVLTVSKESEHSRTLVNKGELYYSVPKFGKNVEIIGGASISTVGSPTSIEVESLTLGSGDSIGYVKIDLNDKITITGGSAGLNVNKAVIICDGLDTLLECPIFDIRGEVDDDKLTRELSKIRFASSNKEKFISLVPEKTENGYTVKLNVSNYSHSYSTWKGTSGDWSSAGNWDGDVPSKSTIATFPQSAAVKKLSVGSGLAFEAKVTGGDYEFEGEGDFTLDRISVVNGSLNVNVPQTPNMGLEIDVSEGASVAFNKPVESGYDLDKIVKTGVGLLTLGASPKWYGSWFFNGGKTVVTNSSSLGGAHDAGSCVSIGAATLRLEINKDNDVDEITIPKALQVDSGNTKPAIIDVEESSVRFSMGMKAVSGGLIKKGAKDVTIVLPEGESTITASNFGNGTGIAESAIEFSETGVPPEAQPDQHAPFGGLTVAEGTLRLTGSGSDKTIVNQKHTLLIGGGGALKSPAALEVSGMKMNQGDSGVHCFVGGVISAGSAATNSVLRVIDGAYFDSDTVNVAIKRHNYPDGRSFANHILAVTNATISVSWVLNVGNNSDRDLKGSFEIGDGGVVEVRGTCINVQGGIGGTVSDGGILRALGGANNQDSTYGLYFQNSVWGELNFVNGGILDVVAVKSSRNTPLELPLTLNFNGGVFRVRGSGAVSMCNKVDKRSFNAGEGGMYINVEDAASRHTIVMPINGVGGIVKTGSGDLFAAKCVQVQDVITQAEGVYTLNCEGVSRVEAGSLTIESGAAREDVKLSVAKGAELRISGNQKLGMISGGGKVTSGCLTSDIEGDPNGETFVVENENAPVSALSCMIDRKASAALETVDVPFFENINLSKVIVDLGVDEDNEPISSKLAVARIGEGVTFNPGVWRAINRPSMTAARFTVENGVVHATLEKVGTLLIVR